MNDEITHQDGKSIVGLKWARWSQLLMGPKAHNKPTVD